jgi:hypothetical protein
MARLSKSMARSIPGAYHTPMARIFCVADRADSPEPVGRIACPSAHSTDKPWQRAHTLAGPRFASGGPSLQRPPPIGTVVTNDFVAVNHLVIRYAFDLPGSPARLRVWTMHYVNPATGRVLGDAAKR